MHAANLLLGSRKQLVLPHAQRNNAGPGRGIQGSLCPCIPPRSPHATDPCSPQGWFSILVFQGCSSCKLPATTCACSLPSHSAQHATGRCTPDPRSVLRRKMLDQTLHQCNCETGSQHTRPGHSGPAQTRSPGTGGFGREACASPSSSHCSRNQVFSQNTHARVEAISAPKGPSSHQGLAAAV